MVNIVTAFLPCSPMGARAGARLPHTSHSRPAFPAVSRRYVLHCSAAGRSFDRMDDNGDGFLGNPEELASAPLGIGLPPNMTDEEIHFVDTAPTPQERMNRLRTIAKKRQNEMQNERIKRGLEKGETHHSDPADNYMANLAKMSTKRELEVQKKLSKLSDQEIHAAAMRVKAAEKDRVDSLRSTPPDRTPKQDMTAPPGRDDLASRERERPAVSDEMKEQPTTPEPSKQATPGNVTGKQIDFLEQYLAKLEAEAAAEDATAPADPVEVDKGLSSWSEAVGSSPTAKSAPSPTSPPAAPPLGDGMGEMTEEETRAAFDAIRARQAEVRDAAPADPYNVVLPSEVEGESRMDESEALRLALIAARIETARYLEAQEDARKEYEENLKAIYAKYTPDLD